MCTAHDHSQGEAAEADAGRRNFRRATALLGAVTATAGVALPAVAEAAEKSGWRPDTACRRFTLAVMPDTQYLFDGPSIDMAPIEESLRYLLEHGEDVNIVFLAHLGDLTQNGAQAEVAAISAAFGILDRRAGLRPGHDRLLILPRAVGAPGTAAPRGATRWERRPLHHRTPGDNYRLDLLQWPWPQQAFRDRCRGTARWGISCRVRKVRSRVLPASPCGACRWH